MRREKRVTAVRAGAVIKSAVDHYRAMQRVGQTPLLVAIGLWLCTLPLMLLLAMPFIGAGKAWTILALLLVAFLAICLRLCDQRTVARRRPESGKG